MNKTKEKYNVHIIGSGVSGLLAAQILEQCGYRPTILEATSSIGGRVKTDIVNGYQLDHGFQVLLDAYPKAIQYLDYGALELQSFLPGAIIYKGGVKQTIGDPLRNIRLLLPTLRASVGTIADKIKILKLNFELKKKTLDTIFNEPEYTTLEYLKNKGFSDRIIEQFFKPFFSGIFLEPNLQTSSRMFEFVYKMFGEGVATIPKAGIGAISEQLCAKLTNTKIIYDSHVKQVLDNQIILSNGERVESDFTIIATDASSLVENLRKQATVWQSCENLYFEVARKTISKPLIGLIADGDALINNIFYCNSLKNDKKGAKELLSVTVVKEHCLSDKELVKKVKSDLSTYCNISEIEFLKHYHIKNALPKLSNIQYDMEPSETKLTETIFLAGDQLLNGSLNAAMISGENAAQALINALEGDGYIG